jgi:hypothetical protein
MERGDINIKTEPENMNQTSEIDLNDSNISSEHHYH